MCTPEQRAELEELFEAQGSYGVKQDFYISCMILGAKFLKNQTPT